MQVSGSVAVITGGASGIGASVAKDLAAAGAKIVLGDMNEDGLKETVSAITAAGGAAIARKCNVVEEADVSALMDAAVSEYGAINIVMANAGIIRDGLMINTDRETGKVSRVMSTDDFRSVIDVNLVGAFITFREAAHRMVDNGWKGVLFVTSSINKVGQPGQLNYSSTKVSVALWPKILVGEFHMKGIKDIRVVGIAPGYAATPILENMNPKALEGILKDVHQGRLVQTKELSGAMMHAVENEAIDGTTLEITGGVTFGPRSRAR